MNLDERDDLSELLARAKPRTPSPAFVQNVMRAVRMSEPEREPGFFEWLRQGWNWTALAGAAAVIAIVALGTQHRSSPEAPAVATYDAAAIEAALQSSDLTAITNLDLLIALDDRNPWLENSRP